MMRTDTRRLKPKSRKTLVLLVLLGLCAAVFAVSVYMAATIKARQAKEDSAFDSIAASVRLARDEREETVPTENGDASADDGSMTMLPEYQGIYALNPDVFGWIYIEGTKIDYPVMYTPEEPEYYLRRAFDGKSAYSGTPFIDGACQPDGGFYLIYGHHMKSGSMFGSLMKYADAAWAREHSEIHFDTLYERRVYEIMAAFYADVALSDGEGFRYYEYTDLSDRDVFEEYVRQVSVASIYDTGVTAEYGDELVALSTCSYHTRDGRFVVVAKRTDR